MMQIGLRTLFKVGERSVAAGYGCSPRQEEDSPFFLTRGQHADIAQRQLQVPLQNKSTILPKTTDHHGQSSKISLKKEKQKTSIKHMEPHRFSISNQNQHRNSQCLTSFQVKASQPINPTKNLENMMLRHTIDYPAAIICHKHLQQGKTQQNDKCLKKQNQSPNMLKTEEKSFHCKIHFMFKSPEENLLNHCKSAKALISHKEQMTQMKKKSRKTSGVSEQHIAEFESKTELKKKDLKSKNSFETHCSESSLIKDHLTHYLNFDSLEALHSDVNANHEKVSLKKHENPQKCFKNMAGLDEVMSVDDQYSVESECESVVIGRLRLSQQFSDESNEMNGSQFLSRGFSLKNL